MANLSDDERSEMFEQVLDWQVRQPLIDGSPSELDLMLYVRHVIMRALEAEGLRWAYSEAGFGAVEFGLRWPMYGKEVTVCHEYPKRCRVYRSA
jgi:hypothetical protein